MTEALTLTSVADRAFAWEGGDSVRYIVASLAARLPATRGRRTAPPVNLALVIDASGSMSGPKLAKAKEAALGVLDRLRDMDRLTVVSFASEAIVHVDAALLSGAARSTARAAIGELSTRGDTNLGEGWFAGASCVANTMSGGAGANSVVILSDGQANAGITGVAELAQHAAGLASRGVTTSSVGIGDDYLQPLLEAIAEHGGGRFHDAEEPAEIVSGITGELFEIENLAARDVSIALHVPATAKAEFVGSAPTQSAGGALTARLGRLVSERPRPCVFRVTLPAGKTGETLLFRVTARGTAPDGAPLEARAAEVAITLVEGARNNRQPRDHAATMVVATAWHAEIARTCARLNRSGDRRQAKRYLERELRRFERYCAGVEEARPLLKEVATLAHHIDRAWDERTRKEMEIRAYMDQSNRVDYRAEKIAWAHRLEEGK